MIQFAEGHILACSLLDYAYTLIDDNNKPEVLMLGK